MQRVTLTNHKYEQLQKLAVEEIVRAYKKFARRKLTHHKNSELQSFYQNYCEKDFRQLLFDLNWRCHFSIYLFLYLKKKAQPYEADRKSRFTISQPIELNFTTVARLAGCARNTVIKAYNELCQKKLIITTAFIPIRKKNRPRKVMIANDFYYVGYEKAEERVYYDFELTTNSSEKVSNN